MLYRTLHYYCPGIGLINNSRADPLPYRTLHHMRTHYSNKASTLHVVHGKGHAMMGQGTSAGLTGVAAAGAVGLEVVCVWTGQAYLYH